MEQNILTPKNQDAELLMPPRADEYSLDSTVYGILEALGKRHWIFPGIEAEFHEIEIRGQEKQRYCFVEKLKGENFEIAFRRNKDQKVAFAPRSSRINIPGKMLYLPEIGCSYGPSLYVHEDDAYLRQDDRHNRLSIMEHECVRYVTPSYLKYNDRMEEPTKVLSKFMQNQSSIDIGKYIDGIGMLIQVGSVIREFDRWLKTYVLQSIQNAQR